jgi:hypothetical protein
MRGQTARLEHNQSYRRLRISELCAATKTKECGQEVTGRGHHARDREPPQGLRFSCSHQAFAQHGKCSHDLLLAAGPAKFVVIGTHAPPTARGLSMHAYTASDPDHHAGRARGWTWSSFASSCIMLPHFFPFIARFCLDLHDLVCEA